MGPRDVGQIISILTGIEHGNVADDVEVRLWPRVVPASNSPNSRFVEPDIIVDLCYVGVLSRTVIEIKWDDVLKREQAEAQVRSCASGLKPTATFNHFSIVKSADLEALEYCETSVRQWYDVLRDLKSVLQLATVHSKVAREWCRDAVSFLEKLGIGTFVGFGKIDFLTVPQNIDIPVFAQYAWARLKPVARINEKFGLSGN